MTTHTATGTLRAALSRIETAKHEELAAYHQAWLKNPTGRLTALHENRAAGLQAAEEILRDELRTETERELLTTWHTTDVTAT